MIEEGYATDVLTPKALDEEPVSALKRARHEWSQRAEHLAKHADEAERFASRARAQADEAVAVSMALSEQWERMSEKAEPRNGAVAQLGGYR